MIHIALCGNISCASGDIEQMLAQSATSLGLEQPSFVRYSNPTDLVASCSQPDDDAPPLDLVISAADLPGITGLQLAKELKQTLPADEETRFVLCAPTARLAREAQELGVWRYLLQPVSQQEVDRVIGPSLVLMERNHAASAVIRCRDGLRRIPFGRLTYVETSGRDQVLHLSGSAATPTIRCSSRAIYSYLEGDGRFYKLGSSYIVNLDFVDALSLRTGMVTLLDGTQIPAPVRLRKPLVDALCSHALIAV